MTYDTSINTQCLQFSQQSTEGYTLSTSMTNCESLLDQVFNFEPTGTNEGVAHIVAADNSGHMFKPSQFGQLPNDTRAGAATGQKIKYWRVANRDGNPVTFDKDKSGTQYTSHPNVGLVSVKLNNDTSVQSDKVYLHDITDMFDPELDSIRITPATDDLPTASSFKTFAGKLYADLSGESSHDSGTVRTIQAEHKNAEGTTIFSKQKIYTDPLYSGNNTGGHGNVWDYASGAGLSVIDKVTWNKGSDNIELPSGAYINQLMVLTVPANTSTQDGSINNVNQLCTNYQTAYIKNSDISTNYDKINNIFKKITHNLSFAADHINVNGTQNWVYSGTDENGVPEAKTAALIKSNFIGRNSDTTTNEGWPDTSSNYTNLYNAVKSSLASTKANIVTNLINLRNRVIQFDASANGGTTTIDQTLPLVFFMPAWRCVSNAQGEVVDFFIEPMLKSPNNTEFNKVFKYTVTAANGLTHNTNTSTWTNDASLSTDWEGIYLLKSDLTYSSTDANFKIKYHEFSQLLNDNKTKIVDTVNTENRAFAQYSFLSPTTSVASNTKPYGDSANVIIAASEFNNFFSVNVDKANGKVFQYERRYSSQSGAFVRTIAAKTNSLILKLEGPAKCLAGSSSDKLPRVSVFLTATKSGSGNHLLQINPTGRLIGTGANSDVTNTDRHRIDISLAGSLNGTEIQYKNVNTLYWGHSPGRDVSANSTAMTADLIAQAAADANFEPAALSKILLQNIVYTLTMSVDFGTTKIETGTTPNLKEWNSGVLLDANFLFHNHISYPRSLEATFTPTWKNGTTAATTNASEKFAMRMKLPADYMERIYDTANSTFYNWKTNEGTADEKVYYITRHRTDINSFYVFFADSNSLNPYRLGDLPVAKDSNGNFTDNIYALKVSSKNDNGLGTVMDLEYNVKNPGAGNPSKKSLFKAIGMNVTTDANGVVTAREATNIDAQYGAWTSSNFATQGANGAPATAAEINNNKLYWEEDWNSQSAGEQISHSDEVTPHLELCLSKDDLLNNLVKITSVSTETKSFNNTNQPAEIDLTCNKFVFGVAPTEAEATTFYNTYLKNKNVNVHVRFDSKISGTDVQGQMPTDSLSTTTDVLSFPRILHTPSVSFFDGQQAYATNKLAPSLSYADRFTDGSIGLNFQPVTNGTMNTAGTGTEHWTQYLRNRTGKSAIARSFLPDYSNAAYSESDVCYNKTGQAVFTADLTWRMFAYSNINGNKYYSWNSTHDASSAQLDTTSAWIKTQQLTTMSDQNLNNMFASGNVYKYTGNSNNMWRTQTIDQVNLTLTMDNKSSIEAIQADPDATTTAAADDVCGNKLIVIPSSGPGTHSGINMARPTIQFAAGVDSTQNTITRNGGIAKWVPSKDIAAYSDNRVQSITIPGALDDVSTNNTQVITKDAASFATYALSLVISDNSQQKVKYVNSLYTATSDLALKYEAKYDNLWNPNDSDVTTPVPVSTGTQNVDISIPAGVLNVTRSGYSGAYKLNAGVNSVLQIEGLQIRSNVLPLTSAMSTADFKLEKTEQGGIKSYFYAAKLDPSGVRFNVSNPHSKQLEIVVDKPILKGDAAGNFIKTNFTYYPVKTELWTRQHGLSDWVLKNTHNMTINDVSTTAGDDFDLILDAPADATDIRIRTIICDLNNNPVVQKDNDYINRINGDYLSVSTNNLWTLPANPDGEYYFVMKPTTGQNTYDVSIAIHNPKNIDGSTKIYHSNGGRLTAGHNSVSMVQIGSTWYINTTFRLGNNVDFYLRNEKSVDGETIVSEKLNIGGTYVKCDPVARYSDLSTAAKQAQFPDGVVNDNLVNVNTTNNNTVTASVLQFFKNGWTFTVPSMVIDTASPNVGNISFTMGQDCSTSYTHMVVVKESGNSNSRGTLSFTGNWNALAGNLVQTKECASFKDNTQHKLEFYKKLTHNASQLTYTSDTLASNNSTQLVLVDTDAKPSVINYELPTNTNGYITNSLSTANNATLKITVPPLLEFLKGLPIKKITDGDNPTGIRCRIDLWEVPADGGNGSWNQIATSYTLQKELTGPNGFPRTTNHVLTFNGLRFGYKYTKLRLKDFSGVGSVSPLPAINQEFTLNETDVNGGLSVPWFLDSQDIFLDTSRTVDPTDPPGGIPRSAINKRVLLTTMATTVDANSKHYLDANVKYHNSTDTTKFTAAELVRNKSVKALMKYASIECFSKQRYMSGDKASSWQTSLKNGRWMSSTKDNNNYTVDIRDGDQANWQYTANVDRKNFKLGEATYSETNAAALAKKLRLFQINPEVELALGSRYLRSTANKNLVTNWPIVQNDMFNDISGNMLFGEESSQDPVISKVIRHTAGSAAVGDAIGDTTEGTHLYDVEFDLNSMPLSTKGTPFNMTYNLLWTKHKLQSYSITDPGLIGNHPTKDDPWSPAHASFSRFPAPSNAYYYKRATQNDDGNGVGTSTNVVYTGFPNPNGNPPGRVATPIYMQKATKSDIVSNTQLENPPTETYPITSTKITKKVKMHPGYLYRFTIKATWGYQSEVDNWAMRGIAGTKKYYDGGELYDNCGNGVNKIGQKDKHCINFVPNEKIEPSNAKLTNNKLTYDLSMNGSLVTNVSCTTLDYDRRTSAGAVPTPTYSMQLSRAGTYGLDDPTYNSPSMIFNQNYDNAANAQPASLSDQFLKLALIPFIYDTSLSAFSSTGLSYNSNMNLVKDSWANDKVGGLPLNWLNNSSLVVNSANDNAKQYRGVQWNSTTYTWENNANGLTNVSYDETILKGLATWGFTQNKKAAIPDEWVNSTRSLDMKGRLIDDWSSKIVDKKLSFTIEHDLDPANNNNYPTLTTDQKNNARLSTTSLSDLQVQRWARLTGTTADASTKQKANCIAPVGTGANSKLKWSVGNPIWFLCTMGDVNKSAELLMYGDKSANNSYISMPDLSIIDLYTSGSSSSTGTDLMDNFVHLTTLANPNNNGLGITNTSTNN